MFWQTSADLIMTKSILRKRKALVSNIYVPGKCLTRKVDLIRKYRSKNNEAKEKEK